MPNYSGIIAPQSTADIVYHRLYEEIVNLDLLPGSKISEAEVSRRFEVTRQPSAPSAPPSSAGSH